MSPNDLELGPQACPPTQAGTDSRDDNANIGATDSLSSPLVPVSGDSDISNKGIGVSGSPEQPHDHTVSAIQDDNVDAEATTSVGAPIARADDQGKDADDAGALGHIPHGAPIARHDGLHSDGLHMNDPFDRPVSISGNILDINSIISQPEQLQQSDEIELQQAAQLATEQNLEPDIIDSDDSALGSDTESTTTSLSESIYNYRKEHGRTYHAYKDGKYIFPNDEVNIHGESVVSPATDALDQREADRLDLQHHILRMTYGNRLYFAPVKDPRRCIDIGTGTGIWAVDFADDHPECEVTGIDLSPGQPTLVPPNLKFIIDDAEDLWVYDQPFDFIHARLMAGCFADWPNFFRQAYQNLEPGGWIEVQDYGLPVKSADGTHDGTDLLRWGELLCEASSKLGRPLGSDCSDHYVQWMHDAGFVDVQQEVFMWPSNSWPKDPYMKELGRWNQINILDGLEGFCLALLTRGLGWRKEEVDVFVARVSRDLRDRKIHAYFPMPVTFGRKPFSHEVVFH